MAFGGMGARNGGFGGLGAALGSPRGAPSLAAPVLAMAPTWTSADDTPDFTISFSSINLIAGDTIRLQIQAAGGNWSSPLSDVTHTITSGELAAGEVDLAPTPLANASYEARANVTHTTTSAWSNTMAFAIDTSKFWFNGLPLDGLVGAVPTGGMKQWFNGLPVAFIG